MDGQPIVTEGDLCGTTLLRIVSRGSAIIAELSRLADHVPAPFLGDYASRAEAPLARKYAPVLLDMRYLREPEMYDRRIDQDATLVDLDEECRESFEELVARFYQLFEGMHRYIADFQQFIHDVESGFYVHHKFDHLIVDTEAKQLLCEAIQLWGVILLLLDRRIPGPVRERLVIAHLRYKGEAQVPTIEEVSRLCRDTGYSPRPGAPQPASYPESFFARFAIPPWLVRRLLDQLCFADVYHQQRAYPEPKHRTFAFAQQASVAFVMLYFLPDVLSEDGSQMRQIVDRHFRDNWVVPVYLGLTVDLTHEWRPYAAAMDSLKQEPLRKGRTEELAVRFTRSLQEGSRTLNELLGEGTLTDTYVMQQLSSIMDTLRECNTSLRWILLHRTTLAPKAQETVLRIVPSRPALLDILLETSRLEYRLKAFLTELLESQETRWNSALTMASSMLDDLSQVFGGQTPLSRVDTDEALEEWFKNLATNVRGLEFHEPVLAGHKIQKLLAALRDVEQFEEIETNAHLMEFLAAIRQELHGMVQLVNVREGALVDINIITDLSYAWSVLGEFVEDMHARIQRDPSSVATMRAAFLKLASILDVPLQRVAQAESRDMRSIAEHYSRKLEGFLRKVVEIVPRMVFRILDHIAVIQTQHMHDVPVRFEAIHLSDVAQLEQRFRLAQATHQVSEFTQGMLAQESTLLGVVQIEPRQILDDGIRKHLVHRICTILHESMQFSGKDWKKRPYDAVRSKLETLRRHLTGLRTSFEYIQDFIGITGLRMWQEEITRVFSFYAEQEANLYLRKQVLPRESKHQSETIPIPLFRAPESMHNFLGELLGALCSILDVGSCIYAPRFAGWYDATGNELGGLRLFRALLHGLTPPGLSALDRVISFRISRLIGECLQRFRQACTEGGMREVLTSVYTDVSPVTRILPSGGKTLQTAGKRIRKTLVPHIDLLQQIGTLQLLRQHIAQELHFACRVDSSMLHSAVRTVNDAVVTDVRRHYHDPELHPYPADKNPILPALADFAEASGFHDPMTKIYTLSDPQPFISVWIALMVVDTTPRLQYDSDFGSLVRSRSKDAVDGYPLLVGISTLLRQLHQEVTRHLIGYLSQYLRSTFHVVLTSKYPTRIPRETLNVLILLRQLPEVLRVSDRMLYSFTPPYVLDAVTLDAF